MCFCTLTGGPTKVDVNIKNLWYQDGFFASKVKTSQSIDSHLFGGGQKGCLY